MGPQHFSRGIDREGLYAACGHWLQWGRSISAAEFSGISVCWIRTSVLQWGRSISAAELHNPVQSPSIRGASMGPQHFSRGIYKDTGKEGPRTTASMGPQHFSRGIGATGTLFISRNGLQWGRSISAAELGRLRTIHHRDHASMGPQHFSRGIDRWYQSPTRIT